MFYDLTLVARGEGVKFYPCPSNPRTLRPACDFLSDLSFPLEKYMEHQNDIIFMSYLYILFSTIEFFCKTSFWCVLLYLLPFQRYERTNRDQCSKFIYFFIFRSVEILKYSTCSRASYLKKVTCPDKILLVLFFFYSDTCKHSC